MDVERPNQLGGWPRTGNCQPGAMSGIRRHIRWALPLAGFLLPVLLGQVDRYWWWVRARYRSTGSHSCSLVRGYAREFERQYGHRPTMDELRPWAVERFTIDLRRMEVDSDIPRWRAPDARMLSVRKRPEPAAVVAP